MYEASSSIIFHDPQIKHSNKKRYWHGSRNGKGLVGDLDIYWDKTVRILLQILSPVIQYGWKRARAEDSEEYGDSGRKSRLG
ncbi:hypothetical protein J6590_025586 [Homalodisca vitripennis]|nr:hypothetical protein J6590_025586 [Homalodisca vitripennis]